MWFPDYFNTIGKRLGRCQEPFPIMVGMRGEILHPPAPKIGTLPWDANSRSDAHVAFATAPPVPA